MMSEIDRISADNAAFVGIMGDLVERASRTSASYEYEIDVLRAALVNAGFHIEYLHDKFSEPRKGNAVLAQPSLVLLCKPLIGHLPPLPSMTSNSANNTADAPACRPAQTARYRIPGTPPLVHPPASDPLVFRTCIRRHDTTRTNIFCQPVSPRVHPCMRAVLS